MCLPRPIGWVQKLTQPNPPRNELGHTECSNTAENFGDHFQLNTGILKQFSFDLNRGEKRCVILLDDKTRKISIITVVKCWSRPLGFTLNCIRENRCRRRSEPKVGTSQDNIHGERVFEILATQAPNHKGTRYRTQGRYSTLLTDWRHNFIPSRIFYLVINRSHYID